MQAKMNPVVEGTATETDAVYLRRAIAMAQTARDKGPHPFGALVVLDGEILGEAHSLKVKDRDGTNHSEMQALKAASAKHPPSVLARATLYASTEPCAMCAGGTYWVGVGRVVFGYSEASLRSQIEQHPWNPVLAMPCREIFARGQRRVEVVGPFLEDEAAKPHQGFWEQRS